METINHKLASGRELTLTTAPGVFIPTGTTDLLIKAVQETVTEPSTLLDLGCGTGIVGLALCLHGLTRPPLYASDLSEPAVQCSRENFARHGCQAEVRSGSLLEPWSGMRFDVIVDDISGVAEDVARVSSWFQGVPCESGQDGTTLVANILRDAASYLAPAGRLFFPVISLSNVDLLISEAGRHFATVKKVARLEWPLPADLKPHIPLLEKLKSEGCITFQSRFGMVLCYTEVYCASNT